MAIIDLNKKLDIKGVADNKCNWIKEDGQEFFESPSGKTVSLAKKNMIGDWWIIKTWRKSSIICELN